LNPDERTPEEAGLFFDYSFYEMGKYDLPAQIDYVLSTTGVKTLSYIAHSQGTSQMFSALAEGHGDLDKKVNLFVALAPIVFMGKTTDSTF